MRFRINEDASICQIHKDGEVKTLKIKEGNSVNKNDIIAEIE